MTTLTSVLAKDWALEVNTGTVSVPVWTPVKGMTKIAPTVDSSAEDDSDFDSDGWGSDVITQRKWKIECEGKRKRDVAEVDFTADPGQEAIRAAGEIIGFDATVGIRWYRRDGAPDAYTGFASVDWTGGGGGVTDLEPIAFTLMGQGARTPITNPAA